MALDDNLFKKIQKKTSVDKDTIMGLAQKLQNGNMKDEATLFEVINTLAKASGREVSNETKEKIVSKILKDDVPKNVEKMF